MTTRTAPKLSSSSASATNGARVAVALVATATAARLFFLAWFHASGALADGARVLGIGLCSDALIALAVGLCAALLRSRILLGALAALALALVTTVDLFFYGYYGDRLNGLVWEFFADRENARLVLRSVASEIGWAHLLGVLAAAVVGAEAIYLVVVRMSARAARITGLAVVCLALVGAALQISGTRPFASRQRLLNAAADAPLLSLLRNLPALHALHTKATAPLDPSELSARTTTGLLYTPQALPKLTRKPRHVVLIVMESFSAWPLDDADTDFADAMGPHMRALRERGFSFDHHVPAAGGTLRNLKELIDSRPLRERESEPLAHVIPADSVATLMRRLGYAPTFFYGGSYDWAHLSSVLPRIGFTELAAGIGAPANFLSALGMPDEALFAMLADRLTTSRDSLFAMVMTTSNHPPYELPATYHPHAVYAPKDVRARIDNPVQARQRLWSYQYSDQALGDFFAQLPPQIFADTLFVITGDHGFRGLLKEDPTRVLIERRVPMIVLGPQLFAGPPRHFTHTTSHRDVLPTLAALLGDAPVPSWGKSLFDTTAPSTVWSEEAFCRAQTCVYNGDVYAWQSDWHLVPLMQSVGTLMIPADEFFSSGAPPR